MFKQFVIFTVLIGKLHLVITVVGDDLFVYLVFLYNYVDAGGESHGTCKENEIWRCGVPSCEAACTPQDPFCQVARFRCTKGCYCAQGYILTTIGGTCIHEEDCALYS